MYTLNYQGSRSSRPCVLVDIKPVTSIFIVIRGQDSRLKYWPSSYLRNRIRSFNLDNLHISFRFAGPLPVTRGILIKNSISGTSSLTRFQILSTMSLSSRIILPQSRAYGLNSCLPPPTLIIACSHTPFVWASAMETSVLHSAAVKQFSNMVAYRPSYSGKSVFFQSTFCLVIFAGWRRKSWGILGPPLLRSSWRVWGMGLAPGL